MLYINKQDLEKLIDYQEFVIEIEKAIKLYESHNYVMPDRISITHNDDTYLYMPFFSDNVKGTKILSLYPNNTSRNEATIQGIMILNNEDTGKIECIIDGATLTAFRTGAVGACGIKHTTPENIKSLGLIGSGVQAYYQCLYATKLRDIKEVYIYDINSKSAMSLKEKLTPILKDIKINVCSSSNELVKQSELIITTTTSFTPVIDNDESLLKNKHFIGIGSYKPNMREFPDALMKLVDKVYIDVDFAKEESGDLYIPIKNNLISEKNILTLGKVIDNPIDTSKTTFYKSVGMSLFDALIAKLIYDKALKLNIGQNIID